MDDRQTMKRLSGNDVRRAFTQANEEVPGPFNLRGRGSEARCHFDKRLAAYMRGVGLPCVILSGYGANKYYPLRLVERAAEILNQSMKREVICFHESCAYIDDPL